MQKHWLFLYKFFRRIKMAFCSNCGKEVADGMKFCANCGNSLPENVTKDVRSGNHEKADVGSLTMEQIAQNHKSYNQPKVVQTGGETKKNIKRNNLLLVSSIFGALSFVGVVIFWIFSLKTSGVDIITGLKNLITAFTDTGDAYIRILILLTIIIPLSLISNIISCVKANNKLTLISGILYILCLNLFSAPLCFIEYFGVKYKIKNKLLFYTMMYTLIFCILIIVLTVFLEDDPSELPYLIYTIIVTGIGIVLNFIAWKTDIKKIKIIAGVLYILGIFTIPSAIICFICSRDNRKLTNNGGII
jgi:hypothetical protein